MDGWIRIGTKVETKEFDAQIKELERKAQTLEKTLETDMQIPVELRMDEESRIKLKSDLQKTKNQIISLQQQANKGVDVKGKETSKNFEDMFKSAKKFAFGLISIRGIYSILSKASQSYMSTDEATTKQMEANWVGLGTILAPAIDLIVNLFKKAVTSVLYFMSVLTGVNYIEKANTAILKKQTKATNDLTRANNKLSASFDEMNVLQEPSASAAKDSGVDTNALFSINDIGEDARKTIEEIGKALQPIYKILKKVIGWALENPEVVLGILGGIGLLSTLSKILGYAGAGTTVGTGLAGILGVLLAIASVAVITISIKTIVDSAKDLHEVNENLREMEKGARKSGDSMVQASEQFWESAEKDSEAVQDIVNTLSILFSSRKNNIQQLLEERKEMAENRYGIALLTGEWENNSQALLTETELMYDNIEALQNGYKQGKLNEEQIASYKEQMEFFSAVIEATGGTVDSLSETFGINREDAEKLIKKYNDVQIELGNLDKSVDISETNVKDFGKEMSNIPNKKTIEFDVETRKATSKTKSWWKSLLNDGLLAPINTLSQNIGLNFKIPYLATGGIVNNPGSGVFMGSYIAGERGREGIIPLTDTQAMQQLGQEIGKWISINATVPVYVGNRQIAREIRKIDAEDNFATNR